MKTGIELIAEERREQIEKHGRTVAEDVRLNSDGQFKQAIYKLLEGQPDLSRYIAKPPDGWDSTIWLHMASKSYKDRLIIIGAFAAAEIDRLNAIESVAP